MLTSVFDHLLCFNLIRCAKRISCQPELNKKEKKKKISVLAGSLWAVEAGNISSVTNLVVPPDVRPSGGVGLTSDA
jgi:hypothetical protein